MVVLRKGNAITIEASGRFPSHIPAQSLGELSPGPSFAESLRQQADLVRQGAITPENFEAYWAFAAQIQPGNSVHDEAFYGPDNELLQGEDAYNASLVWSRHRPEDWVVGEDEERDLSLIRGAFEGLTDQFDERIPTEIPPGKPRRMTVDEVGPACEYLGRVLGINTNNVELSSLAQAAQARIDLSRAINRGKFDELFKQIVMRDPRATQDRYTQLRQPDEGSRVADSDSTPVPQIVEPPTVKTDENIGRLTSGQSSTPRSHRQPRRLGRRAQREARAVGLRGTLSPDVPVPVSDSYDADAQGSPAVEPQAASGFDTTETKPDPREATIQLVARCQYDLAVAANSGRKERRALRRALGQADVYLRDTFEADTPKSQQVLDRLRFFDEVADEQRRVAETNDPANRSFNKVVSVVMDVLTNPWIRYGTATVAIGALAASFFLVPGGPVLATVATAAKWRALRSAGTGLVMGTLFGLHTASNERKSRAKVGMLVNRQQTVLRGVESIAAANLGQGVTATDTVDYSLFEQESRDAVLRTADRSRRHNRWRRLRVVGWSSVRGAFAASWRGALGGAVFDAYSGGTESVSAATSSADIPAPPDTPDAPPTTPEQAAQQWMAQNNQNWTAATQHAASGFTDGAGPYAEVQNAANIPDSGVVSTYFPDATPGGSSLESLIHNGVDVQVDGDWTLTPDGNIAVSGDGTNGSIASMNANHVVISADAYQALQHGILPNDVMTFQGDLLQQDGHAAALITYNANPAYTVLSQSQFAALVQSASTVGTLVW